MKTPMTIKLLLFGLAATLFFPVAAAANESTTIHGKIVERRCLSENVIEHISECPIDKVDPRSNGENEYLLMTNENTLYFLPNVPLNLKEKMVDAPVVVTGKILSKYQSLMVDKITENGKMLWCNREMILNDNVIYPCPVPDLCSY